MLQVLLWSNMIGFALMVASAALVWLEYIRQRLHWLRSYLLYQGFHALWTLFSTYVFFETVFLPEPIPWLTGTLAFVRLAASLGIAAFGLMFYLQLAGVNRGIAIRFAVSLPALLALLVAATFVFELSQFSLAANILFNVALAGASWMAGAAVLGSRVGLRRAMLPFVAYTTVAYAVVAAANAWYSVRPSAVDFLTVNVLAQGAFIILWSLIVGITFLRRAVNAGETDGSLPTNFVRDYCITNREAEIVTEISRGSTNKAIGEKLFISQRTVETHIYNVYRKCGVANRVELLRLIRRY